MEDNNKLEANTILMLIMDYLHQHKLFKSLLAIEEETDLHLYSYCNEMKFFRKLMIEGQWEDAENFLQPLRIKNFDHNSVIFEIKRQKFLEMIESNESYMAYVNALKELKGL